MHPSHHGLNAGINVIKQILSWLSVALRYTQRVATNSQDWIFEKHSEVR